MNRREIFALILAATLACTGAGSRQSDRADTANGPSELNKESADLLRVDIIVAAVQMRGDTAGITHIVHNGRANKDSLATFVVEARSGVVRMRRPEPARNWAAFQDFSGRPMVNWGLLRFLPPDSTTPPLYYESIGIPGIVAFWVGPDVPPKGGEDEEPGPSDPPRDPLETEMRAGQTVGVEPWPTDQSPLGLVMRLADLTDRSCKAPLFWITSPTLCAQLKTTLIGARGQIATNRAGARSQLSDYIALLSGTSRSTFAAGVTNPGYWLLKSNAQIILDRL